MAVILITNIRTDITKYFAGIDGDAVLIHSSIDYAEVDTKADLMIHYKVLTYMLSKADYLIRWGE